MAQIFKNNVFATLASALSDADTAVTLTVGCGERFPVLLSGEYFLATLIGLNSNSVEAHWEIVKCTARDADVLTVERAQEGTLAGVWPTGSRIEMRVTAGALGSFVAEDAVKRQIFKSSLIGV